MTRLLLLLVTLQAQDPVQIRARLTEPEVHAGETTIFRVDVETDGPRARIERFRTLPPGIELEGTRDFDQRQFSVPGGTRRFISREFVLRTRAPGRYRIPSLDVVVDGDVYTTGSALLTVTSAPTRERGETREGPDGVLLRAWLDSDTVFVGEQVTLQVEAMFSQDARLRLRRAPEYEPPSPSGFWIHDLPDRRSPVSRTVGNEVYEVQRFRRAFFPLAPGDYTIPPAHLEYEMRRGMLYAPETHELASDPLPLVVLPVPPSQPPDFTGAVGDYALRARLEPARVPVGEAAVLTVEVEGTGNVKALPPPRLPELQGMDVFPPSEAASTEARGSVIRGTKAFTWVLIPRESGEHEIPGIRYAYFDPDAGGFETAEVAPLTLRATPGAADDAASPLPTLRYLKTEPSPGDPLGWVRSRWFLAAQLLPLLLLVGALAWRRGWGRRDGLSAGALRRRRKRALRELEERAADPGDPLFGDAEAFARQWLADRLGVPTRRASSAEALETEGVPADTARAVQQILDRLSAARYAPTPPGVEARRDIVRALARVLKRIDRDAPSPRSRAGAAGAAGAVAGLALAMAAGATGLAAQQGSFAEGLAAFDANRYDRAAEAFERYVDANPGDAAGWYNLGTAYYRADRRGPAIWAWLHVPRLDPRDGDTRHNLRVAGVAPELVSRVAPPLPLRSSELGLLAALGWLVAGAAGAAWVARRARAAGGVAIAAALLAAAMAGGWWDSTRERETLIVLDSTTLRAGPTLREDPVSALEPGTGLVPVSEYGDWVRARTLRGEEGWVERGVTGPI